MTDFTEPARKDGGTAKIFSVSLEFSGVTPLAQCMRQLNRRHISLIDANPVLSKDLGLLALVDHRAFAKYIGHFDSADGFSVSLAYKHLSVAYPNSKFVLFSEPSPGHWADSLLESYNQSSDDDLYNFWCQGDLCSSDRRIKLIRRYESHVSNVREFFGETNSLIEIRGGQGDELEQLYRFLGEPIPGVPPVSPGAPSSREPRDIIKKAILEGRATKAALFLSNHHSDPSLVDHARGLLINRINQLVTRAGTPLSKPAALPQRDVRISRPVPPVGGGNHRYKLAVCSIFRDEARYLDEWLTFHHGVGVEHFFLYNDRSKDHYESVLEPWIRRGLVTLVNWPEQENSQIAAFNHCLSTNRQAAKWIAFIDADEFLFSPSGIALPSLLERYDRFAGVFVYWALFGSGGHEKAPLEGVIEAYRKCQSLSTAIVDTFDHGIPGTSSHVTGWSRDGKSIVQPSLVSFMDAHQPRAVRAGVVVDENMRPMPRAAYHRRTCQEPFSYSLFRINHYWSKSIEELVRRSERGCIYDRHRPAKDFSRVLERETYFNEVVDETIIPVWERIRSQSRPDSLD